MPADVRNGAESTHVKLLQLFDMWSENHSSVIVEFCGEANVALIEYTDVNLPKCSACLADPG